MKATFALLANTEVYNRVRKLAWEIHQQVQTGTLHCRLPPHISLKQPFRIPNLAELEDYMAELAGSIEPFEVFLPKIGIDSFVHEGSEYGILWLEVQEQVELRQLHNRLNEELNRRFGDTRADFDGPDYRFHMTAMIGGRLIGDYLKFYEALGDPAVNLRFTVRDLAMFVYDEPMGPNGEYLCYQIQPIGKRSIKARDERTDYFIG